MSPTQESAATQESGTLAVPDARAAVASAWAQENTPAVPRLATTDLPVVLWQLAHLDEPERGGG